MKTLSPEQFAELNGTEVGASEWFTVQQDRVDEFARATDDFQFIHVDPEKARATPFGGTIAHGFLTLSLLPMFMQQAALPVPAGLKMGVNYGGNKTRFLAPVKVGARIRGRFRQLAFDARAPGQFQHVLEYVVEIEGEEKPALIAEWVLQYFV